MAQTLIKDSRKNAEKLELRKRLHVNIVTKFGFIKIKGLLSLSETVL